MPEHMEATLPIKMMYVNQKSNEFPVFAQGDSHFELDAFKMAPAAGYLILGAKISSQSSKSRLLDPEK